MYEAGSKWWPGGNMFLQNYIWFLITKRMLLHARRSNSSITNTATLHTSGLQYKKHTKSVLK
jgi:hypothetical protein